MNRDLQLQEKVKRKFVYCPKLIIQPNIPGSIATVPKKVRTRGIISLTAPLNRGNPKKEG